MKNTSWAAAYVPLMLLGVVAPMLLIAVLATAVGDGNTAATVTMVGLCLIQVGSVFGMGVALGNHLRQRKAGEADV